MNRDGSVSESVDRSSADCDSGVTRIPVDGVAPEGNGATPH